jgi:membrane protease YdiL (CAAX protease family)
MIPESDPAPRPALSLELAFVLALLAPLVHLLWTILFTQIGFQLSISAIGMAALVTYGGLFALCASRLRGPPARVLGFVAAPGPAWLAVVFLLGTIVLTSEVDNVLKAWHPPTPQPPESAAPPYYGAALAVVYIGVFPLVYEVFFRGVLQPLATTRLGVVPGLMLTTAMSGFGASFLIAVSGDALAVLVPAFIEALVLSILRQSAGSLLPVLALHTLWGVVMICAQYHVFGLAGFDAGGAHTPTPWVAGAALATGIGLGLCRVAARIGAARRSSPARG